MRLLDHFNITELNGVLEWMQRTWATLTGTETLTNKTLTSPVINTSISGTAITDEDDMVSDSDTKVPTEQSVKAYVDNTIAGYGYVPHSLATAANDFLVASGAGVFAKQTLAETKTTLSLDNMCRIKTGTYTGDGSTTKAITGVGFQPKYVRIWKHPTVDEGDIALYERLDQSWGNYAVGGAVIVATPQYSIKSYANTIISLDDDGFTVDDAGGDGNPNKNAQVYDYLCLG